MNILWVLSLACLAMVKTQVDEAFKAYRNYRSSAKDPYFRASPNYHPVVFGMPSSLAFVPQNTPFYSGYPLEQIPLQLYSQPLASGYDQVRGRNDAPASRASGGDGYYAADGVARKGADKHANSSKRFLSKDFIDSINQAQKIWKAVDNFADEPDIYDYVGDICGVRDPTVGMPNLLAPVSYNIKEIPPLFDARAYAPWGMCKSLQEVRDQGSCGSCWAIAAVECMTDRICIASKGKEQCHLSTMDLLECCTSCGYGCDGGFPGIAWSYYKETGIVTGGEFNSTDAEKGCKPYLMEPCAHHTKRSLLKRCSAGAKTPACEKTCDNGKPYNEDLHFGDLAYSIDKKVESIQLEIMNYGPVQASFEVYEDFLSYGSGVYFHVNGSKVGDHAMKLIGWGTENNTAYWLCVNSWGRDWGLLGGFVKVKRGNDECKIESNVVAGKPKVKQNDDYHHLSHTPRNDIITKKTPFVNGNIQAPAGNRNLLNGNKDAPFASEKVRSPLLDGNVRTPFVNGNNRTPFVNGNVETPFANG